jgi:hypothetical protein
MPTNSASSNIRNYQYMGAYLWPAVRRKHEANLRLVLEFPAALLTKAFLTC